MSMAICFVLAACDRAEWGPGCRNPCTCLHFGACHVMSGACICTPGWRGLACHEGKQFGNFSTASFQLVIAQFWQRTSLRFRLDEKKEIRTLRGVLNDRWFSMKGGEREVSLCWFTSSIRPCARLDMACAEAHS